MNISPSEIYEVVLYTKLLLENKKVEEPDLAQKLKASEASLKEALGKLAKIDLAKQVEADKDKPVVTLDAKNLPEELKINSPTVLG